MVRVIEKSVTAHDGLNLFVRVWENSNVRAQVLLTHGYAEHSGRYQALGELLAENGIRVVAYDLRGHGRSGGPRGYAETFADFVTDIENVRRLCVADKPNTPLFLLGHSFGGLLAIHYAAEQPVNGLQGLILSSPYLKLRLDPPAWKVGLGKVLSRVLPKAVLKTELSPEMISSLPEEVALYQNDPLNLKVVSPRWFTEVLEAQTSSQSLADRIHIPLFAFWGEDDPIADPTCMQAWVEACPSLDKVKRTFAKARHETLHDYCAQQVRSELLQWVLQRSDGGQA